MILIADSGSTKTDWCLVREDGQTTGCKTQGINPFHQSKDVICGVLANELLPCLDKGEINKICFYGSGCTKETSPIVGDAISSLFPDVNTVEVHGDLLGAARALCGNCEGIACILGTGANSCLYNGKEIVKNTPPLGYILGDEGSGAVLGKHFFNKMFKGGLPSDLCKQYLDSEQMTMSDVVRRVYREPLANRFLASTSMFICKHLECCELRELVVLNFRDFFKRNIQQYGRTDLPINAVGSMAYFYKELFKEAAESEGYVVGEILRSPMAGLIQYHKD